MNFAQNHILYITSEIHLVISFFLQLTVQRKLGTCNKDVGRGFKYRQAQQLALITSMCVLYIYEYS